MDASQRNQKSAKEKLNVPLCVDLDGTLVKTDMFWESFLLLLKRNLLYVFVLPLWMSKGKAYCKSKIAARVAIDVEVLPYQSPLLEFLRTAWKAGREITLATGTDLKIAKKISKYHGIFEQIIASDGVNNLTGKRKLQKILYEYGKRGYDYAGNSTVDLPIWENARGALVVSSSTRLIKRVSQVTSIQATYPGYSKPFLKLSQSLRRPYFLNNFLLCVPLLTTHPLTWSMGIQKLTIAFFAFFFGVVSVSILSDLFDLQNDRHHPQKKFRAFATGESPVVLGLIMVPVFTLVALGLSVLLPFAFQWNLWLFLLIAVMHALYLKSYFGSHIVGLAGLYTLQVTAGAAAMEIPQSYWLLAFPIFLLTSFVWERRKAILKTRAGLETAQESLKNV